jgi:hypothetical protein
MIPVVNPKRGPKRSSDEKPRSRSPASDNRRSGPNPAVTSAICKPRRPPNPPPRAKKGIEEHIVLTRTTTASLAGRASSMRRMRRRTMQSNRPYCRTNGCASFLDVDPTTGVASCPICGYRLRPH